jgi:DNA-binding MarR family transcriptional regulator
LHVVNDDNTKDQARQLYQTVRMLKDRLGHKFSSRHRESGVPCADLTFAQSNVLIVVQEQGELSLKELADALHVSRPSASTMVDRLVEMGALAREQSKVDRREVRIRLSETGQERFRQMEEEMLGYITELLTKVGPEYAAQWCDVYAKVREIIQAERAMEAAGPDVKDSLV